MLARRRQRAPTKPNNSRKDNDRRRQPRRLASSKYKRQTSSARTTSRRRGRRSSSQNVEISINVRPQLRSRTAKGLVANSRDFTTRNKEYYKSITGAVKKRRRVLRNHRDGRKVRYGRDDKKSLSKINKNQQPLPTYFNDSSAVTDGSLVASKDQPPLPQIEADKLHHEMIKRDVFQDGESLTTTWDDIAGLEPMKRLLQEACVLPFLMPKFFVKIRRPWRGVLLYGPPGVGKTMLARAVAKECRTSFFNVSLATILSQWVGESEKLLRVLFDMARELAPSTIFIDEFDAIFSKRSAGDDADASRRVRAEFMVQLDGLTTSADEDKRHIMVLAATNSPWDLEDAIRRRLEKQIYIPLPDQEARENALRMFMRGTNLSCDVNFHELAAELEGFSGADIKSICRNAALNSLRQRVHGLSFDEIKKMSQRGWNRPVSMADFRDVLKTAYKTVTAETVAKYDRWTAENAHV